MAIKIRNICVFLKRIGRTIMRFRRRGTDVVWERPSSVASGLSRTSVSFDPNGNSIGGNTVILSFPSAVFSFTDLETNVQIPDGINVSFIRLPSSGTTRLIQFTITADVNRDVNQIRDQIIITLNNDNMALNITVNRAGQADLTSIDLNTGVAETIDVGGGTQGLSVTSNPGGATYTLTVRQSGTDDDTAAVSFGLGGITTGTARAAGAAIVTQHVIIWAANTLIRQRAVTIRATNDAVPSDFVEITLRQAANLAVDASFEAADTSPFIGESDVLTATILSGVGAYDYRIFSGDVSTSETLPFSRTVVGNNNLVATEDNRVAASFTYSATAVDGENTYTLFVRDTNEAVVSRVLTFYGSAAYLYQDYSFQSNVPWFRESANLQFVFPSSISASLLSATVLGTDASIASTGVSLGSVPGLSVYNVTVNWSTANGSTTSNRVASVTISYNGAPVLGTLTATQLLRNSTITSLTITDSEGNTGIRDWDDLTARQIGASISNFPDGVNNIFFSQIINNITQTLTFAKASSSGTGNNRTLVVNRGSVTDSQLTNAGISQGQSIVLQGSVGQYDTVTVGTVNSTQITFTGVSFAVAELTPRDSNVSHTIFTTVSGSGSSGPTPAAVTGVTIGGNASTYSTVAPAGYKANVTLSSINTDPDAVGRHLYNVVYRGATIGSLFVNQNPRPKVVQELLIADTSTTPITLTIDTDDTFNTQIAAATGTDFSLYVLHDVSDTFTSVTDGVGEDFISLTPENTPQALALPTGFSSTVPAIGGDNIDTSDYARYTRVDLTTANANDSTSTQSDTICINID